MKLTITIKMDNAAFEEGYKGYEAARILRELAKDIEYNAAHVVLRDINGNTVGVAEITN